MTTSKEVITMQFSLMPSQSAALDDPKPSSPAPLSTCRGVPVLLRDPCADLSGEHAFLLAPNGRPVADTPEAGLG